MHDGAFSAIKEENMIKTLQFGEKEVTFSTAFAWAFIYKGQFGEDPMVALVPAIKSVLSDPEVAGLPDGGEKDQVQALLLLERLGVVGVAQISWAMAKLADPNVPVPMAWIASFGDDFPVMDLIGELITEALMSCFATKKSGAPIPAEPKKTKEKK